MAGDTVITTFGADDSPFQAAAQRVKNAIMGIFGFKGPPGGIAAFGQAASHFGNLGRGAASAVSSIGLLTSAFRTLGPAIAAVTGVGSAFAAVLLSFKKATDIEQTVFQIQNLGGGATKTAHAIQSINDIAQQTATPFAEIGQKAKTLMQAGLSADQAAQGVGRLQKIAVLTGESFEDLADIYARVQLKQEVTVRDLNKLKAVPGVAQIAEQFRQLEIETSKADRAAEHQGQIEQHLAEERRYNFQVKTEAMRWEYEQSEKQINASTELAGKLGLGQQLFAQWAKFGRASPVAGFGGLNETTIAAINTGVAQLERESGLTESQLRRFAAQGKIGFDDLIQAAARYRAEQEKITEREAARAEREAEHKAQEAAFQRQEEHYKRQEDLLEKQRGLIGQIGDAIKAVTDPGGAFSNLGKYFETFGGKLKTMMYDIQTAFANFGTPLLDALKPVMDLINGKWMPALQDLAKKFGTWMSGEIGEILKAFQTGDWSVIQKQVGDALRFAFKAVTEFLFEQMQRVAIAFRDIIVDIFTGGNIMQALKGLATVFLNVGQIFGKMIASGVVHALADAFKGAPFGIGKMFEGAAEKMDQLVNPEEIQKNLDTAFDAFKEFQAGVEGIGTKIIEDWGKEVKKLFPEATPQVVAPSAVTPITPETMPVPVTPSPQDAAAEEARIDKIIRAFIANPENQKQTSLLQELNRNLTAVLSIA